MAAKLLRSASKNTFMLFAATMVRMVASFIFVLFAASKMGVAGFGKYSITIFYFELFLSLTATAIGILLTRDAARWRRNLNQLFTSAVILNIVLWIGSAVLMLLISLSFGFSDDAVAAVQISILALLPAAICVACEAVYVAVERAEFVTLGTAFESLLRIALSLAALRMGHGLITLVWILVVVRLLLLPVYLFTLASIHDIRWAYCRKRCLRFASRWRVFAAENWLATIYTNLDVLVLSTLVGEVSVGLYTAAWKVVRLGSVLAKSYTTAIFPIMSRLHAASKSQFSSLYQQTIRGMCMIAIPTAVAVLVFANPIISRLFDAEFSKATEILQVLIWGLLIEFLNPFLSHALFAQGQQRRSMYVAGLSLSFNIIVTLALVWRYQAVGAAAGTVISGLFATLLYMHFLMPRTEVIQSLLSILRIGTAASIAGLLLFTIQSQPLPVIVGVGVSVYAILLFAFQAIHSEDLDVVRSIVRTRAV